VTDDLSFINTSTIIGGVIQKSKWTFGDGTSSNLMHPHHNYATFGNFPISLIVESNLGCIDSLFTSLYINENPVANFTSINGCAKQPLLFTDGSVIGNGSIQGWIWDFGDGFFGSEQNPQHAFESDGFYSVQLTAVSDSGCRNTILISNVVEVYSLPEANFSATPWEASIFTPQIKFTDESVGAIQWQWNFDDGIGQSTIPSPTYNYSNLGHFNVELVVMNNLGCFDTIYKEVIISPDLFIYIPNAFTPNNDGYNDFFSPSGIGFANMNMSIFNRWGEEVFSGNSLSEGWDGKDRKGDQYCNEGAYVYKVKVVDYFNTPHEYSGVVTLLR